MGTMYDAWLAADQRDHPKRYRKRTPLEAEVDRKIALHDMFDRGHGPGGHPKPKPAPEPVAHGYGNLYHWHLPNGTARITRASSGYWLVVNFYYARVSGRKRFATPLSEAMARALMVPGSNPIEATWEYHDYEGKAK